MNSLKLAQLAALGLLASAAVVFSQSQGFVYQPVPSVEHPYVGHGGTGLGRGRALNDLELTAVTRATEAVEVLTGAVIQAQAALVEATFSQPGNRNEIAARTQALADAELKLAIARADAYGKLKADLHVTTPEKAQALANAL